MPKMEIEQLINFGRQASIQRKTYEIWQNMFKEILKMPQYMQEIVLDDIATAINNRIKTMTMILEAQKRQR